MLDEDQYLEELASLLHQAGHWLFLHCGKMSFMMFSCSLTSSYPAWEIY